MTEAHFQQQFDLTDKISWVEVDGTYKYMAGEFGTEVGAKALSDRLKAKGHSGTFVVIFYHEKRISREEANILRNSRLR